MLLAAINAFAFKVKHSTTLRESCHSHLHIHICIFTIPDYLKQKKSASGSITDCGSSDSGRISVKTIENIIEQFKTKQCRETTAKNYTRIWRIFNKFLVKLDSMPKDWEDRTSLFIAHMVNEGLQSTTIKCYVSAIKKTLVLDGYDWNDNRVLLGTLTRACKLVNDTIKTRLPIHCSLLELILFEFQRDYASQPYLHILYKAIFMLGYYGLMRAGELVLNDCNHAV